MVRVHTMGTAAGVLALGLACAGLGGAGSEAPAEPETEVARAQPEPPRTLSFGKPEGWTQDKQTYTSDGHQVIHYVLSGPAASVQLVLHPPGAEPPSATAELAGFRQELSQESSIQVRFGELQSRTRALSGSQVEGTVLPLTVTIDDQSVQAEHGVWLVRGPRTSCLVVVDVPDVSDPSQTSAVDEVLTRLRVP